MQKEKKCDLGLQQNTFYKDSILLKLPSEWKKIDTTIYPNPAIKYSRIIYSNDTSSSFMITVNDYAVYNRWEKDFEIMRKEMRGRLYETSLMNDSLIKEELRELNGYKISLTKISYFDGRHNKYACSGNIFYIIPAKKFVHMQMTIAESNQQKADERLDCIFNSLQVK